jgi:serine-type D-Ala-D-Ala carboxypeptidase (penicillin-binding protein 5/6)
MLSVALTVAILAASHRWVSRGSHAHAKGRATLATAHAPPLVPSAAAARPRPLLAYPVVRPRSGPAFTAPSAILVDASTGAVLWAKRAHARRPVASTTKIMTAVLALERLRPGDKITIARSVRRVEAFREGLRPRERVRVWKLLYGLMLFSGNDDALALAIGTAGSRGAFIGLMNEKAKTLGLRDSHFSSPSGVIDSGNRSSAWDLAALARYAMRDGRFRAIVRTRVKRVRWAAPTYGKIYVNRNDLLRSYPGADGIKTGWTTLAGHCLVASAHRRGVALIAVVLHSGNAYGDVKRLLNYGFRLAGRGSAGASPARPA